MDAEFAGLASSGATTIVNLMASNAWDQVRARVCALWHRFVPGQADAVTDDLDRTCVEIQGADEAVVLAVIRELESRLLRLLATDAAVTGELRRVVSELEQVRPGRQQRVNVQQRARASGQSTVIQVAGDGRFGDLPLAGAMGRRSVRQLSGSLDAADLLRAGRIQGERVCRAGRELTR